MIGRAAQTASDARVVRSEPASSPHLADASFVVAEDATVSVWDAGAERFFGMPASDALGQPLRAVLGDALSPELGVELAAFLSGAEPVAAGLRLELHSHPRTGEPRPLALALTRLTLPTGDCFAVYVRELRGGDNLAHQLWLIEQRFRALVEQIPAVVFTDDVAPPYETLYISPYIETLLGYSEDEWRADPTLWTRSIHRDDLERVLAEDDRTNDSGEPFSVEYRLLRRDGRVVWVREESVLVRDEHGQARVWQGVFFDISAQKQLEHQLTEHAFQDPLTGLPNRTVLYERLRRAALTGQPLALMFVDLDNFKAVNDAHGHVAGDEIMVKAVQRIENALRHADLVTRYGGDEFAVLLSDASDPALVEAVAHRLVQAFQRPFSLHGQEVSVTLSIGVVYAVCPAQEPGELLRRADAAMYVAKARGRNSYELVAL